MLSMMSSIGPLKPDRDGLLVRLGVFLLAGLCLSIPFCSPLAIQLNGILLSLVGIALAIGNRYRPTLALVTFSSPLWIAVLWALGSLSISRFGRAFDSYYLFLGVPLFLSQTRLWGSQLKSILGLFILATAAAFMITLIVAFSDYFRGLAPYTGRLTDLFFHEQLGFAVFDGHPTYFSLLACTSSLLLVFLFPERKWVCLVLIIFFTCFVTILMARITLLIQLALLLFFLYRNFAVTKRMRLLTMLVATVIFCVLYFTAIKTYDYPHRKLFQNFTSHWKRSAEPGLAITDWGVTTRFALWRSSWQLIRANFWTGVGDRSEKDALASQLKAQGQDFVAGLMLDSHNQYLSFLIVYGFLGTATLLGCQAYLIISSKSNPPYYLFIAIIALVACTEGLLLRILGVSHVAVVGSILFFWNRNSLK